MTKVRIESTKFGAIRSIGMAVPPSRFVTGDVCTWEVSYPDGSFVGERYGTEYKAIDRDRLFSFRIVRAGEIMFECWPPDGQTGRSLVYRRRTAGVALADRNVLFVVGWAHSGPVHFLDFQGNGIHTIPWFHVQGAAYGVPDPSPADGELFTQADLVAPSDRGLVGLNLKGA